MAAAGLMLGSLAADYTSILTFARAAEEESLPEETEESLDTTEEETGEAEESSEDLDTEEDTLVNAGAYQMPMRDLSAEEIVSEMGTGWNLGNTMDGHTGLTPNETLWQNVVTTKALVKSVHDMGFNTIRIPVTWGTMINEEDYSIDETWMSRVEDIVDYAISQDMYVIINIHHDGAEQTGWIRVAAEDPEPMYEEFAGVWTTIAERFKNYDEHLIFESMNEVKGTDESVAGVTKDTEVINELNQIFVDSVRATGSNNANRWLSVPSRYTNIGAATNATYGFKLPEDSAENRLFVAVHCYDWSFGMEESMGDTEYSEKDAVSLESQFLALKEKFTSQGIPVILGEYGCINKNNPTDRAYYAECVNYICKEMGIVPVYWDQGWYDRSEEPADYSFSLVDRETGESIDQEVTDGLMRGMYLNYTSLQDISKDPEVTEIESINITDGKILDGQIELDLLDSYQMVWATVPANTNDVVLWKTEDPNVATVSNGLVRARGIGETTLTAYSQSGSTEAQVKVIVSQGDYQVSCTGIDLQQKEYDLEEGDTAYLNAVMNPTDTDCTITYRSSDESVATVNTQGKIVATGIGSAYIIATASNGITSYAHVNVAKKTYDSVLRLALNVLYNDNDRSCWNNEVGPVIEVREDGQYTVTFDCATDLSDETKDAGISTLENLTAIYIKDQDVTDGLIAISNLESCDITYDKVVVNGEEMTITKPDAKSALKDSGIFDTNDPINSWDGSAVDGISSAGHVANFKEIEDPTTVEVTFTLSNLVFANTDEDTEEETEEETEEAAYELTSKTAATFSLLTGESSDVTINVTQNGEAVEGVRVAFIPTDEAIAYASATAVETDAKGDSTCTITGNLEGTAIINVLLPDGTAQKLTVEVVKEQEEVETGKIADLTTEEETTAEYQETPAEHNQNLAAVAMLGVLLAIILLFVGIGVFVVVSANKSKK